MSTTTIVIYQNLNEVCELVEMPESQICELVELGVIEPEGRDPEEWQFDSHMVSLLKRAVRLHRDLDINWAGVAVAIQLLHDVEHLRTENQRLRQRLGRFLEG